MTKPKQVNRYRVRTSQGYCSLCYSFDDKGVIIPDATQSTAHIFLTKAGAENAISRTIAAQKAAKMSMFPEFPVFKKLFFDCDATIEVFQVDSE